MSDTPLPIEPGGELPDIFTRLSIAMCPQDDGTRPVNPAWVGSDIGFLSPAIKFATFPVPVGQPTNVSVLVRNHGTADATGVLLETTYNVYLGLQPQTMIGVQNMTIPLVPAGGSVPATVTWTPQNASIAHACFHARVFDSFSKLHFPLRCQSWDSYINPQAGNHNTIIVTIPDPEQPVVITYPVINTDAAPITPKLLATVIDQRARLADLDERFPLPFVPDHLTSTSVLTAEAVESVLAAAEAPYEIGLDRVRAMPGFPLGEMARPVPVHSTDRLWPRPEVDDRFRHERFGFDEDESIELPVGEPAIRRATFSSRQPLHDVHLRSFARIRLAPNEERVIRFVIPPEEFPPRGRRKKFQIDFQIGDERPVQNFVYLYH